tara:strand:- start:167 stop:289 length:123 start_codon:yes stop_codon:yes gene_type:complete
MRNPRIENHITVHSSEVMFLNYSGVTFARRRIFLKELMNI